MKKGIIFSAILVLALAGIAFSHGSWKGSSGGWREGHWGGRGTGLFPIVWLSLKYREEITLDQGQISALEGIQDGFRAEAEAQFDKIRILREGLKTNLEQDDFDAAKVKIEEMGAIRTSLSKKRVDAFRETKAKILTPDQYNKLKEIIGGKWGS